jgi:hypothetical protein
MNTDYRVLLEQVIAHFFPTHDFDLKGKLKWYPTTKEQRARYFKRNGREMKPQRRRYKITEVFWKKEKGKTYGGGYSNHHHILISAIEQDGTFYCVNDHCVGGKMGMVTRYSFKIVEERNEADNVSYAAEYLGSYSLMIR